MPHRELLTESQRLSLQTPASDERGMVRHYTLSSEDLALINRRRGDPNRLGLERTSDAGSGPTWVASRFSSTPTIGRWPNTIASSRSYFVICVFQGGYFNKVSNHLLLYAPSSLSN